MSIQENYKKFNDKLQVHGLAKTIKKSLLILCAEINVKLNLFDTVYFRQMHLSNKIDKLFESTVRYGLFKGLKLSNNSWWGKKERAAILLGIYELEVLEWLKGIPGNYNTFIDVGAAEGYYAVGVLVSNKFKNTICFEMSESGRNVIKKNALLNNVVERIQIYGRAELGFYNLIPKEILDISVVMLDIEGAEFSLLTEEAFKALDKSIIIIELHDWFYSNGFSLLEELKNNSSSTHKITEARTSLRDLSIFKELENFSDTDRWLLCSEDRGKLMCWLRFDPISDVL